MYTLFPAFCTMFSTCLFQNMSWEIGMIYLFHINTINLCIRYGVPKVAILCKTDNNFFRFVFINFNVILFSWTEHRSYESILTGLNTTRELLGFVVRRKLSFCGQTIRDGGCDLVKCLIQVKLSGKRRRGRPKTLDSSSNITK